MMARKLKIESPGFLRHTTARGTEHCSGSMEPQTETCKTEGRPLGQEIYSLYFYPFRFRAVLGKRIETKGWRPDIKDGVEINIALWERLGMSEDRG